MTNIFDGGYADERRRRTGCNFCNNIRRNARETESIAGYRRSRQGWTLAPRASGCPRGKWQEKYPKCKEERFSWQAVFVVHPSMKSRSVDRRGSTPLFETYRPIPRRREARSALAPRRQAIRIWPALVGTSVHPVVPVSCFSFRCFFPYLPGTLSWTTLSLCCLSRISDKERTIRRTSERASEREEREREKVTGRVKEKQKEREKDWEK